VIDVLRQIAVVLAIVLAALMTGCDGSDPSVVDATPPLLDDGGESFDGGERLDAGDAATGPRDGGGAGDGGRRAGLSVIGAFTTTSMVRSGGSLTVVAGFEWARPTCAGSLCAVGGFRR
jgi:hypothetical protein